jgi:hypothetical protein
MPKSIKKKKKVSAKKGKITASKIGRAVASGVTLGGSEMVLGLAKKLKSKSTRKQIKKSKPKKLKIRRALSSKLSKPKPKKKKVSTRKKYSGKKGRQV